jgi:glutaredoxin
MITPDLYVKVGCPWCDDVIDYLISKGIAFNLITVSGNRPAMDKMVALSGQSKAPTMDWCGEILADFGVEELAAFLTKRGIA